MIHKCKFITHKGPEFEEEDEHTDPVLAKLLRENKVAPNKEERTGFKFGFINTEDISFAFEAEEGTLVSLNTGVTMLIETPISVLADLADLP